MKISQYDILDIADIILKIEKTFDIRFKENELEYVTNFGEIIDHTTKKIDSKYDDSCTSQQAFYKLKSAFKDVLNIDIEPDNKMDDLIIKKNRRKTVIELNKNLGFDSQILKPEPWITNFLTAILVLSVIIFFWNSYLTGFIFFVITISGFILSNKYSNYFNVRTIKDFVKKITKENYIKVRRNRNSINKIEVEKIITDFFTEQLGIEKNGLTRETLV